MKPFKLFLLSLLSSAAVLNASPADLVIRNAKVITVDRSFSIQEAIAISDGKVLFVGKNAETRKYIGADTQIIDAGGKTVMPGIYDNHVHSWRAAVSELGGGSPFVHSIAEAQGWIRKQTTIKPINEWIVLERVYATRMTEGRLPTKAELDAAAPNHPVLWNSGPVCIVNSKALAVSKITRDTPDPKPGQIVKHPETGEPTGVLRNAAQILNYGGTTRQTTPQEWLQALKHLYRLYNQQGITSIGERRADKEAIDMFRELERTGELSVRINCSRVMEPVPKTLDDALKQFSQMTTAAPGKLPYGPTGYGTDWVRIGPFKVLLDGGMLIGTAYMSEPWGVNDIYQITDPGFRGILNVKPEILNPLYLQAAREGWQLTAHTVGDAAVDTLLDAYENIAKEMDISRRRFLVTHANFPSPNALERSKTLGVVADVQPAWLYKDGEVLKKVLGPQRMKNFFPLRSWLDHGVVIAGGSDHMVQLDSIDSTNPWNPWLGIWAAVTRHTERGGVDKPEQCLSRKEAIRFYTINCAYCNFEESRKGSLEPGKLADLILLDRDPLTCPAEELRSVKVLRTIVGGKTVWNQQ